MKPELKPKFIERMHKLLSNDEDFENFNEIIHKPPRNFIRCNTLKISPSILFERLSKKWIVSQPFPEHHEIMLINSDLKPGELGNAIEHLLGYYYIQEISSMMSVLALNPKPNEFILDLCASPGSKTTQIVAGMQNSGTLIANDFKLDRIMILSSNLERCGVTNCIITRNDAINICSRISKTQLRFDKILLDVPCSGEGTLRSSPKTFEMWNENIVHKLSRQQKKFIAFALKCLKPKGTLVYSTCTHSPEENESVIDFALKNFPVKIETLSLPLNCRQGVISWYGDKYSNETLKCCRIYPHDNDSEGFFVSKLTLLEEMK
ncbi:RsmB/NOP family class I SAM-dependent RNA methyltransferase [Candidatus Pacearchaeota archaeon]|nr:RsmB/NOP family class I SAM-dependent RNA methyltransferase [Candidatus Pacearchaeota archaeon]